MDYHPRWPAVMPSCPDHVHPQQGTSPVLTQLGRVGGGGVVWGGPSQMAPQERGRAVSRQPNLG